MNPRFKKEKKRKDGFVQIGRHDTGIGEQQTLDAHLYIILYNKNNRL